MPARATTSNGTHDAPARRAIDGCADPIVARVCALHHTLMRVADRVLSPIGLTAARLMLLKRIDLAGEAPTVTWLSGQLMLSTQAVSRMVGTLERQRLVRRTVRAGGGRSVFVELTPTGRRAVQKAQGLLGEVSRELRAGLTPDDEHAIEHMLDRMVMSLRGLDASPGEWAATDGVMEND